jgi:CRISPR-associated exonuclease Cas4
MSDPVIVAISALEHWDYCERQCALIHADGVWADNRHTIRGNREHRRVDSGGHRTERGRRVLRSIPLWSESLGLTGRADAVEIHPAGRVVPVEYKAGSRHGRSAELQLCAQAMCLEEMLAVEVPEGAIWYGAPKRRSTIQLGSELRQTTLRAIERIREAMVTGALAPAPNDRRCTQCQLLHYCLPSVVERPERAAEYVRREVLGCAT